MGVTKLVLEITGIEVLTVNSIWLQKKTVAGKHFLFGVSQTSLLSKYLLLVSSHLLKTKFWKENCLSCPVEKGVNLPSLSRKTK